jgi:hypothetical protein
MALKLRRGTDSERTSIVFGEGEPVYVTDTRELYIGDGSTSGGNRVVSSLSAETTPSLGGPLDLNGNNIVGTGNINIDGNITATGTINLGDGVEDNVIVGGQIASSLMPDADGVYDLGSDSLRWRNGYFEGVDIAGEITVDTISVARIIDQDSSVLYDSDSGTFTGDGSGLTNLAINEYSIFDLNDAFTFTSPNRGDLLIFDGFNFTPQQIQRIEGADSTVIVDATNNTFTGTFIGDGFFEGLELDRIISNDLRVERPDSGQNITSIVGRENRAVLNLENFSENDISVPDILYGSIFFQKNDINGPLATGVIAGTIDSLLFTTDSTGAFTNDAQFFTFTDTGFFGIGTQNPQSTLDVRGSAVIEGDLTVSALKGSVVSDDSTIIIDSVDNTITSGGYIQFGSYTSADRPNGVNGMVIYNSTVDRFQGFQANGWINLDDGTAA